jgi:hypothetical protein
MSNILEFLDIGYPTSETVVAPDKMVQKQFDWDGTVRLKPDPFFDASRWAATIGGDEKSASQAAVPSTTSEAIS